MSTFNPLVTVVIPCFNEEPNIVRASLGSVRNQSFRDFECIVVDESTEPELAENCRLICDEDHRFTYIHPNKRLGLSGSLNLGISLAKGELVARFDSDDICLPTRLANQILFMQANPTVGVVGGAMEIIDDSGTTTAVRHYPLDHISISRKLQYTNAFAHPTVMFRKSIVERFGAYSPEFKFAEDLELWLRLLNRGVRFANMQEVLVQYRQGETNRQMKNWRYNLKARILHISKDLFFLRLLGIVAISIWSITPDFMQKKIYQLAILKKQIRV